VSQRISNPFPVMFDRRGRPLTGGKVYIGQAGEDPELLPVDVFFDDALTIAAPQPIAVVGGLMMRDSSPALIFIAENDYSLRVRDADGAEVFYAANVVSAVESWQPLDSDLTAIAALSTTSYGRGLLTLANAAALRSYAGLVDSLPLTGGTLTGEVKRSGAGAYPYMVGTGYNVARIFVTANGAADPRTQVGDIWLEEVAP
jgi:hypothetical protein